MAQSVECGACGRSYPVKAEYAGRKLKCKCGATFAVPAEDQDTYDFAEPEPPKAASQVQRSAAAPVPRSPRANPPRPGAPMPSRPSMRGTDSEPSGMGKLWAGVSGILLAIFIGVKLLRIAVFAMHSSTPSAQAAPAIPPPQLSEVDERVEAMMKSGTMITMAEWIKGPPKGRILGGYSPKQSENLYREKWLKELGVVEVWLQPRELSQLVIFELPRNPTKRHAIYAWQAKYHEDQHLPINTDTGGNYLMINIPLVKPS